MNNTLVVDMLNPGSVRIDPRGRLEASQFAWYLQTCKEAGGRFDKNLRTQVVPIASLERVARELVRLGFEIQGTPAVLSVLEEIQERIQKDSGAAVVRLERVDAELKARGLALFPFQRDGVRWLAPREAGLLADEMGLGKTVQALISLPDEAPVLVVGPAAVKGVWAAEARRWRPDFVVYTLSGRGSFRWPRPGEIVALNYDILPEHLPGTPHPGTVVVADEAHALKSSKALRTHRFREISDTVRKAKGRTWLLTGTPLLNQPAELWTVLRAAGLEKEAFGSWPKFVALFNGRKGRWGGFEWGGPKREVPELLRRVSLLRRRAEVLPQLPEKIWREVEVRIDAETRRQCNEILDALRERGLDLEQPIEIERLQSIGFEEMSAARAALATAKIPAVLELVEPFEDAGEPIVVFSAHRGPVDALGARDGWATITGDVPAEERTRIVEAFQAGQLRGLAATIQAAGVGLTLTRAHQAIFVDLGWTPALNQQAEDRLCRIGQTRGVIITRLVGDHPLDSRVTELLDEKQRLIAGAVEASARVNVAPPAPVAPLPITPVLVAPVTPIRQESPADPARPAVSQQDARPTRRQPATDLERWAARGLEQLAMMDADRAQEENGVGFSKLDGEFGHSLANQLHRGLTDKQWGAAVRLATKYRRQVGSPPSAKTAEG